VRQTAAVAQQATIDFVNGALGGQRVSASSGGDFGFGHSFARACLVGIVVMLTGLFQLIAMIVRCIEMPRPVVSERRLPQQLRRAPPPCRRSSYRERPA
jgi:hypothetical protein